MFRNKQGQQADACATLLIMIKCLKEYAIDPKRCGKGVLCLKLEELLNAKYELLNAGDRALAQYILAHQAVCSASNCEQLAVACHVSRATLLRFCRKLGLDSFAELKYLLKAAPPTPSAAPTELHVQFEAYHRVIDELVKRDYRDVCALLYKASTIYIYGTGNAQKSEAEEFKRIFLSVGKCVVDLFDMGEIAFAKQDFRPDDLFVIISLSGETPAGIDIMREVASTSVGTLSITRWDNNTIARMCRNNLYVGTETMQGYRAFSYELMGAFYVLLDTLFVGYLDFVRRGLRAD